MFTTALILAAAAPSIKARTGTAGIPSADPGAAPPIAALHATGGLRNTPKAL